MDNPFEIKKIYLNINEKLDIRDKEKILKLKTSNFNKNFHIFENKFTLIEFIKNDRFNYLNLIFEYYYQIICRLLKIKEKYNKNDDINNICEKLNMKINNLLNFFEKMIIDKNLYSDFLIETNRFLCQMLVAIKKFLDIHILNFDSITFLVKLLNYFNYELNITLKNNFNNKILYLIRDNLFDFLLIPKL